MFRCCFTICIFILILSYKSHTKGIEMKIKKIITPSSNFNNPFQGRNPEEVWSELMAKSKPVDKDKILDKLAQQIKKKKE